MQFLLTVIRSYIYTADNANCLRLFLACRRKEMKKKKPIKSKRKTHDVFHQKPYSKTNVTQKSSPFLQLYRFVVLRCSPWAVVRFFLLSTFENYFLTMKNSYHKAFVPSRRVNYYKHVKFDLRDNITSRDVTKRLRICRQNSKDQMFV